MLLRTLLYFTYKIQSQAQLKHQVRIFNQNPNSRNIFNIDLKTLNCLMMNIPQKLHL